MHFTRIICFPPEGSMFSSSSDLPLSTTCFVLLPLTDLGLVTWLFDFFTAFFPSALASFKQRTSIVSGSEERDVRPTLRLAMMHDCCDDIPNLHLSIFQTQSPCWISWMESDKIRILEFGVHMKSKLSWLGMWDQNPFWNQCECACQHRAENP